MAHVPTEARLPTAARRSWLTVASFNDGPCRQARAPGLRRPVRGGPPSEGRQRLHRLLTKEGPARICQAQPASTWDRRFRSRQAHTTKLFHSNEKHPDADLERPRQGRQTASQSVRQRHGGPYVGGLQSQF
jgi:hypothetical protein